jgi:hypothetical protein
MMRPSVSEAIVWPQANEGVFMWCAFGGVATLLYVVSSTQPV